MYKWLLLSFFLFIFGSIFLFLIPTQTHAQTVTRPPVSCDSKFSGVVKTSEFPAESGHNQPLTVKVNVDPTLARTDFNYFLLISDSGKILRADRRSNPYQRFTAGSTAPLVFTWDAATPFDYIEADYDLMLMHQESFGEERICNLGKVHITHNEIRQAQCSFKMPAQIKAGEQIPVEITSAQPGGPPSGVKYIFYIAKPGESIIDRVIKVAKYQDRALGDISKEVSKDNITGPTNFNNLSANFGNGNFVAILRAYKEEIAFNRDASTFLRYCASLPIKIGNEPTSSTPVNSIPIIPPLPGTVGAGVADTCKGGITSSSCAKSKIAECDPVSGLAGKEGILTAIGCLPTSPPAIVNALLRFVIFAGGGIALLLMIIGAIRMITSSGNADTLKGGRDQFTAAFMGLLFILFAVLFLEIVGVNILQIPGLR